MKTKFISIFFLIPFILLSQNKPFYKQTITAYEINKKDTINKKVFITYLDSLRKIITSENNISNAIANREKTHSIIEVDTDRLYVSADIDEKGETTGKIVYVYDDKKNQIENYQIRKGDTVNAQKRTYNEAGNNTKLFNRHKGSNKYFLSMEWDYDYKGNVIESKTYNQLEKLVEYNKYENTYKKDEQIITEFTYINDKGFVKTHKIIKNGNSKTIYYYKDSAGYNYGLKISFKDGSFSVEERDKDDCLKEYRVYDDNKKLVVYVKSTEIKL